MTKTSLLAAMLLAVSVALCGAQEYKLGVHGGYSLAGDIEEESVGWGLQGSAQLTDLVSVELSGTMFEDDLDGFDLGITTVALTGRYGDILVADLMTYVGGGVSYNLFDVSGGNLVSDDIDNAFGFHICLGAECMVSERWELFADFRYNFMEIDGSVEASATVIDIDTGQPLTITGQGDIDFSDFGLVRFGVNFWL